MKDEIAAVLAVQPFLRGLDAKHVKVLARHAREERFAANALLLREGEPATGSLIVISGAVGLEIHAHGWPVQIASIEAGEVVGWSWLTPPSKWHFDARAKGDVAALALDGAKLLDECEKDPTLGYALLRRFLPVVTRRLEAMRLQLLDLYAPTGSDLPWA